MQLACVVVVVIVADAAQARAPVFIVAADVVVTVAAAVAVAWQRSLQTTDGNHKQQIPHLSSALQLVGASTLTHTHNRLIIEICICRHLRHTHSCIEEMTKKSCQKH